MFGSHRNNNSSELNESEYFFAERCKRRFKSGENTKSTDGKIKYDKPILPFLDFMQI